MPDDLKLYADSVSAANVVEQPYAVNTSGTVISSVAWDVSGNRVARGRIDSSSFRPVYSLEVLSSTSIRVLSATEGGDETESNDYTVAAGGTYETLVPGVSIVLNGSLTTGHTAKVTVGILADAEELYLSRDAVSAERMYIAKNPDATYSARRCRARIGRGAEFVNTSGSPLAALYPAPGTPNPTVDTWALTISNGTSSGKKYTFTGAATGAVAVDNCATGTVYDIGSTGLKFKTPGSAASNTDTASVTVHELADALELAPDSSGVPGTWVPWDSVEGVLLELIPAGSTLSNIAAGGTVNFWLRANVPADQIPGEQFARIWLEYGWEVE